MIEIAEAVYPIGERKTRTYWRVFQDGQHVRSFTEKKEAEDYAKQLRDCERMGA